MTLTAAYGLLAHALIFGALAALPPLGALRPRVAMTATAIALLIGIAPAMHGTLGTPSLTLLQLALLQHAGRPSPLTGKAAGVLLAVAAVFYPLALGLGPVDPYAAGFHRSGLLAALAALGLILAWRGQAVWLGILGIDLLGYAGGVVGNLWDAAIDPLLIGVAAVVGLRQLLRRRALTRAGGG